MRAPWTVVIAAGWMLGCGGSGGSVTTSFQVKGVVGVIGPPRTCNDPRTPVSTIVLELDFSTLFDTAFMSDLANYCVAGTNETSYVVKIWANGASPAIAPGLYQVTQDASGGMAAFVIHFDAGCSQTPIVMATTGTLQLTTVSTTRVAGQVNLVFEDGRKASDAFDAPVVTAPESACAMLGVPDQGATVPSKFCATMRCQP
jgi:hypothetical protein